MAEDTTVYYRIDAQVCEHCLNGEGGECHEPGCMFWMNRAPDIALTHSAFVNWRPVEAAP